MLLPSGFGLSGAPLAGLSLRSGLLAGGLLNLPAPERCLMVWRWWGGGIGGAFALLMPASVPPAGAGRCGRYAGARHWLQARCSLSFLVEGVWLI